MSTYSQCNYELLIFHFFVDDFFQYAYAFLVADNSSAFDVFMIYKTKVEHQHEKTIKIATSDRGRESCERYDDGNHFFELPANYL